MELFKHCLSYLSASLQGMRKHKLLREDILPAMASNRKVQRLLNEFMDLLSEYESAEINLDKRDSMPPITAQQETTPMDCYPPAIDQMNSDLQVINQMNSAPPVTVCMDSAIITANETNCTPLATDQVDSEPILTDQVIPDSPAGDSGS